MFQLDLVMASVVILAAVAAIMYEAVVLLEKIILKTIRKVLKKEDIETEGMETAEDLCDYLLRTGKISKEEYKEKMR